MHACMLSLVQLSATLWTVACQVTLSHQVPLSKDFLGKNSGVGCHSLFQGIFLAQGENLHFWHLLHGR